jgi:hypothetical protein
VPVYDWSKAVPTSTSPVWGAGKDLSAKITTDFAGKPRSSGSFDIGAIVKP